MGGELKDDEVLYRQIHPTFLQGGQPSSQAFTPTEKDGGRLSVDRSSRTGAKDSWLRHTGNGFASAAVFGVTVDEFAAEGIVCYDDPIPTGPLLNPAHAVADYAPHAKSRWKIIAKRLKLKACARGAQYLPATPDET